MRAFSLLLLSFFLIPVSTFAANSGKASSKGSQCQTLFVPASVRLQKKLDLLREGDYEIAVADQAYKVSGEMHSRPLNLVVDDPHSIVAHIKFVARPAAGTKGSASKEAGNGDVAYFPAARKLDIARTFIVKEFQRKGLTTLTVGAGLEMFPDTEVITGRFIEENWNYFKTVYSQSMGETHEARMIEAIRATPFYKTVSAHGFSEIDLRASYYRPEKEKPVDKVFVQLRRP